MLAEPGCGACGYRDAATRSSSASRARCEIGQIEGAELFLCPSSVHLFADPSLGDYDSAAAELLRQRTLSFLGRIN